MVQIIHENRKPTAWQNFGLGIGKGLEHTLEKSMEAYEARQKHKKFSEALRGVEDVYANPDSSEQQKLIKAYQLMGQFPDAADKLTNSLSRFGLQQQKSYSDRLKGEQDQQKTAKAFQNIQNIYNNPDITEEQKIFGVYQELSKNPTLAHNLLGSIQQKNKAQGEDIAGAQYSKGYNAILEGDNNSLKSILEDPTTPLPVKKQLTDLKSKHETRKSVESRELRNRQALVQRSYKQAIEAERKKITKEVYPRQPKAEIDRIAKNIKKLEALQRNDLKRLAKSPDSYTILSLWNAVDPNYLPEEENELEDFNKPKEVEKQKVKFNPKNPEHVSRATKVLEEVNGDRDRANKILAEEFNR
jgi:hypothetical protein